MPRKDEPETVAVDDYPHVVNPHHILTDCDVSWVRGVQAKRIGGPTVGTFSEIATMAEIRGQLQATAGIGVYELSGLDHTNRRLPGAVRVEIQEDPAAKLLFLRREDQGAGPAPLGAGLSDAATKLLETQTARLTDLEKTLQTERTTLNKERFEQEQKLLDEKREAQKDSLTMIMGFLTKQTEAERTLRQEQDHLRSLAEERERERERKAAEQQREFELHRQAAMAEVERARAEIEAERIRTLQQEMARRIEEERRFNELKIAQIQAAAQQETLLARRMAELELEQKKQELDRKYGFVGDDSVPKSILEELWQRRLDKEYPEESALDGILKKYVEPLIALFQAGKISLPGLTGRGNVPVQGALPPGAPEGSEQAGAVELGEYEDDTEEGDEPDVPEPEPVALPRGAFS